MAKFLKQPFWILIHCFAALGIVASLLMTAQPQFEARWGIDNLQWSWVLFVTGLGGIASYPVNSWLLRRWGSVLLLRRFALLGGGVIALTPWLPGLNGLLAGMFAQGMIYAGVNVSVNLLAAQVEVRETRRMMGSLHGAFYIGAMLAALASGGLVAAGLSLPLHRLLAGMLVAAIHLFASYALVAEARPVSEKAAVSRLNWSWLRLGLLATCTAIAEGGISGWASIYLHQSLGASARVAGLGLALFSGSMALGRILCDRLAERFGAARLVGIGALCAGVTLVLAIFLHTLSAALIALSVTGLGMAAVFPMLFSVAGKLSANSVASIAGMGAVGGLLGPFLLGRISASISLDAVMLTVAAVNAAIVWQAGVLRVSRDAWRPGAVSTVR